MVGAAPMHAAITPMDVEGSLMAADRDWQRSPVHTLVGGPDVGGALTYFLHEDGKMTPHFPVGP